MASYQRFNQDVSLFQQSITNSTKMPIDRLNTLWHLSFDPDKTQITESVAGKSWKENKNEYVYETYWSCIDHNCGKDKSCCYGSRYHWVTKTYTYYYNEKTIIQNEYKNILQGSSTNLIPLNCGYYSRDFSISPPTSYLSYESPHISSGDRRAGTTYVNFKREYGSRIEGSYKLDEATIKFATTVARATNQNAAAATLAKELEDFLAAALVAFKSTGANYPAVQDNIRDQIPRLMDTATAINATLQDDAAVLAHHRNMFERVDTIYKGGLTLWLPQFFLVPIGVAAFTFTILYFCKDKFKPHASVQNDVELNRPVRDDAVRIDVELDRPRSPELPPPAYESVIPSNSPTFFPSVQKSIQNMNEPYPNQIEQEPQSLHCKPA